MKANNKYNGHMGGGGGDVKSGHIKGMTSYEGYVNHNNILYAYLVPRDHDHIIVEALCSSHTYEI